MTSNSQPRERGGFEVEMAIAAVENSPLPSPLDVDMDVDPDPTCLDLTLPSKPDNGHGGRRAKKASGVPAQRNHLTEVPK